MKILRMNKKDYSRSKGLLKKYANIIQEKIKRCGENYDAIFSIGTLPVTYLKTEIPIYIYTDGTVNLLKNYYDDFSNFSNKTINKLNYFEINSLNKATKIFSASEWLKESIVNDYNIDSDKVKVVKIGANFESNLNYSQINKLISRRSEKEIIRLLFVGVDWKRKGGEKVVDIANKLIERGIKVHVDFVGIKKRIINGAKFEYKFFGFLDKSNDEDSKKLFKLYEEASYFILPTKAECVGSVFCEAASFGLPSISNNTGGISSLVKNNITGKLFYENETTEIIADFIKENFNKKVKYKEMSVNAYKSFYEELNWNSITENIKKEIKDDIIEKK